MRWDVFCVAAACLVAAGCEEPSAPKPWPDGTLVLEVGGPQASLRAALASVGVVVEAPHLLRTAAERSRGTPVDAVGSGRDHGSATPAESDAKVSPSPEPGASPVGGAPGGAGEEGPQVAAPPAAQFFTVPLGEGRTLVHLAKKYLGNGNRYQELLELNGWTLQQAKRLGATQLVKIPIDPANGTEPK